MADVAIRKPVLAGRLGGSANVRLTVAPAASRVALRAPPES
ncbi:MAG: sarcosine oxidase subunit gamma, partial [Mesorhizobium sp.]|nr:sarcosine oxidase subunit gamma [Mesorhizobium sp.]